MIDMTPSHYPDDDGTVRTIGSPEANDRRQYLAVTDDRSHRTDPQRHTDHALDTAEAAAKAMLEQAKLSLGWMESIGAEVPTRFKALDVVIEQYLTFIDDERKRRG